MASRLATFYARDQVETTYATLCIGCNPKGRLNDVRATPPPPPPPPPAAGGMAPNAIEQLKQLGELHEQGILTDEEFAAQKKAVLGN